MSDTRGNTVSIAERVRSTTAGAPIVAVHFMDEQAVFVLGEENLLFVAPDGSERRIAVHAGAILESTADKNRIVTGGDDGKVVATAADGTTMVIASDAKRRWVDHVALAPDGSVAWSVGKSVHVKAPNGDDRSLEVPSTPGALAFAPKGLRLAIAHYNGVSLWFPNASAAPETLPWKGSHLGVTFSPDGRFLMAAMQEPALHGWRLVDNRDMRMSGYSARVRSFDWSADGKWLASSGSEQLILWPFQSKDGPMGKQPRMLAPADVRVSVVACHPKDEVIAVGYANGMVLLVRVDDGAEILARRPAGEAISAMSWDAAGKTLGFGTEDGAAGLLAV